MSILGDVFGFLGSGRAAKAVSDANIAAEHGVLNAGESANRGLGEAGNRIGATVAPYTGAGVQGLTGLENYVSSNPQFKFNPQDYFNSPAYNFELEQGKNAITNSASAMGLGSSGNTLRDLTSFGMGTAAKYYDQAFREAQNTFQTNQNATLANLSTLIGAGEFGANLGSNLDYRIAALQGENSMNAAQSAGNFAVGAGQARASGIMNQMGALSSFGGDIFGLAAGGGEYGILGDILGHPPS